MLALGFSFSLLLLGRYPAYKRLYVGIVPSSSLYIPTDPLFPRVGTTMKVIKRDLVHIVQEDSLSSYRHGHKVNVAGNTEEARPALFYYPKTGKRTL